MPWRPKRLEEWRLVLSTAALSDKNKCHPLASALQEAQDEDISGQAEDDDSSSDGGSSAATSDGPSALLADSRMSFLALGGFVYFAADGRVVSVNALTNGPGLEFSSFAVYINELKV